MIKSKRKRKEERDMKHLFGKAKRNFLYIFVFSVACIIYALLVTVYMLSIFSLHIKALLSFKNKLFDYFNLTACQCKFLHEYWSDYQFVHFIKYLYAYISFFSMQTLLFWMK